MTLAQARTDDKHYLPTCSVLARLVEDAKTAYPGKADGDRIQRGGALVESGAVTLHEDGVATVLRHGLYYTVGGFTPHTCKDIEVGGALQRRCKHKWAACLARKLAQASRDMRRLVASVGEGPTQQHGILTAWRDGRAWFQPYDESVPGWALSEWEIAYALFPGAPVD